MNFREIMMTLNSNIKVPLNKLIDKKPSGIYINPYYKQYDKLLVPDVTSNIGTVDVSEAIKRDNELYVIDTSGCLRVIQLNTTNASMKTLKQLTVDTYSGPHLLIVTKTYVYGTVSDSASSTTKVFRYNKDTGEYKVSVASIGSPYNYYDSVFVSYEDEIFMYVAKDGYYTITDTIDLNGSLTFLKLNSNYPNGYTASNQALYNNDFNSIRCRIELPNRTILAAIGSQYDDRLMFYKINIDNGSWSVIEAYGIDSHHGYVLTPIKHNDKIVGVLIGVAEGSIKLYKIDSNNTLTLLETYTTVTSVTSIPDTKRILTYDNGIIYECTKANPRYIKYPVRLIQSSAVSTHNRIYYFPNGTRIAQGYDGNIHKIKPNLIDSLIFEGDELDVDSILHPDENGIVTIDESGLYSMPYSSSKGDFVPYGTIF